MTHDFGKAIRLVRAARGMGQKQLAELAQINTSTVSLIEGGKRVPSMDLLSTLALALEFPVFLLCSLAAPKEEFDLMPEQGQMSMGRWIVRRLMGLPEHSAPSPCPNGTAAQWCECDQCKRARDDL